jgi:hypothetical protein
MFYEERIEILTAQIQKFKTNQLETNKEICLDIEENNKIKI